MSMQSTYIYGRHAVKELIQNHPERIQGVFVSIGAEMEFKPSRCHLDGFGQVGREFGVTRERIRQIEAKALERIRFHERAKQLKSY